MSADRKTRPDAVLRNLPEARQDAIGALMLPGPENKSLGAIQKELAADGIKVSQNALSRFFSGWCLRQQRKANEQLAEDLIEQERAAHPEWSDADFFAFGQRTFGRLALQQQNPEEWARINLVEQRQRKLDLWEKELKLSREKFEFDAAKACLKKLPSLKAISNNNALDEDEKIKQIRLELFGEAPE